MTLRYHLDENAYGALATGLTIRGIDITTSPQVGLRTAADEDQLAYCLREQRVLITYDSDFLRLNTQGAQHCGIAFCPIRERALGKIIRDLVMLSQRFEPQAMYGRVEYL